MPKLNIDMFDEAPKVGDKIKVLGTIKTIDEDGGEVEASYDDVSILDSKEKSSSKDSSSDSKDYPDEMMPESQSLDSALSKAFPNTQ